MKQFLSMLIFVAIAFFVIYAWHSLFKFDCFSFIFPTFIILTISVNIITKDIKNRQCIANFYFKKNSFMYFFLHGRVLISIFSIFKAIIFSLPFILFVPIMQYQEFLILFSGAFFIMISYILFSKLTANSLKNRVNTTFTKELVIYTNSIILIFAFVVLQYYSTIPDFVDPNSFNNSLANSSYLAFSHCGSLQYLMQINLEKEIFLWFVMLYGNENITNESFRYLFWGLFFINSGLISFAFSRFLTELISLQERLNFGNNRKK
jgi:hypothetical protein